MGNVGKMSNLSAEEISRSLQDDLSNASTQMGSVKDESILIRSNTILTFDGRQSARLESSSAWGQVWDIELVYMPSVGIVSSILLTILLVSFALWLALSCWRRSKATAEQRSGNRDSPLEHPRAVPNPMLCRAPLGAFDIDVLRQRQD